MSHENAQLRERIRAALEAAGLSATPEQFDSDIHSWRCSHPDRYGRCTCLDDLIGSLAVAATGILPPLIGLTGRKRSGKDAAAQALVEERGFRRVAFADPIKRILEDVNPYLDGDRQEGGTDEDAWYRMRACLGIALLRRAGIHASDDRLEESMRRLSPITSGTVRVSDLLDERDGWDGAKDESDSMCRELRRLQQVLGTEAVRGVYGDDVWVKHAMAVASGLRGSGHPVVVTDVRFNNEAEAVRAAGGAIIGVSRPDLGPPRDAHASESGVNTDLVNTVVRNDGTLEDLRGRILAAV